MRRFGQICIVIGILFPILYCLFPYVSSRLNSPETGWTFYGPYVSMYVDTAHIVAQPLMMVVAMGNLMLYVGWRRLEANRKGSLLWIGLGLFLPLFLEILPHLLAMTTAQPPRRYHYYYLSPEQPSAFLTLLGLPGWMGHTISLVFLFFGIIVCGAQNREPVIELVDE